MTKPRKPKKATTPKPPGGGKGPKMPAELKAMMESMMAGGGMGPRTPAMEAQEMVYEAMETRTEAVRERLLNEALTIDPDNVDALLMLAEASDLELGERIELLREIVETGAERLGAKAFQEFAGHFWGFHETRPYMRARAALADGLRAAGRLGEAVDEYAAMLELNPGDNQGLRYELLPCLLGLGRLEEARELMAKYPGECGWHTVFAWGHVLERVLEGDDAGARKALTVARKQNVHMEGYLLGMVARPKGMPEGYSSGSPEEAVCFAKLLVMAWARHPEAEDWLEEQAR